MRDLLRRTVRTLLDRYPLRVRATWLMLIDFGASYAIRFGLDEALTESVSNLAIAAVNVAVVLGFVASSEKKTTPVAAPRDDAGRPLTPGPIGSDVPVYESADPVFDALPPI